MEHARDLTVILVLKDRVDFTYRWMRWMSEQNFPYKILIADGGGDQTIESHLMEYKNYPNLNYEYIRYPFDSDAEKYVAKLFDSSLRVKTRYILLADNDDLIMLEPLEENLRFLRERPDVHSICPAQYRFKINRYDGDSTNVVYANGLSITVSRLPFTSMPLLESDNPLNRLFSVVEKFCANFIYYGIHRAEEWKLITEALHSMKIKRFLLMELFTCYVYALNGRNIIDKTIPYLVRQDDTSQCAIPTYSIENHANIILLRDWSEGLYSMIDWLYSRCGDMRIKVDRNQFEERFREAFKRDMLYWVGFRGFADLFKKYPWAYTIGRKLLAAFRGKKNMSVTGKQVAKEKGLVKVLEFLKNDKKPPSKLIK